MINVTIAHKNGQREEVLLAGVPRVGESIRLKSCAPSGPSLVVNGVLWSEHRGPNNEPGVIAFVERQSNGLRL